MPEISCPKCGMAFTIDQSGYAEIVKQVHDEEFEKALKERSDQAEREKNSAVQIIEIKKNAEIQKLEDTLKHEKTLQKIAITDAMNALEKEHEQQIRLKDEQIEKYRDYKARLSTKMIGESLEQHCEVEFNKQRAAGFGNAYLEKDSDTSSGSKGDYIFRESDLDGNEFISIMFEMKNENDETKGKQKNETFFKELDKDRNEKNCEYAVLVSLLELENDFYNTGIVDVSHRYPKMYVVRPQFFIPIITLLRNASKSALEYKAELAKVKAQNIDVTTFENELDEFKRTFGKNITLYSDRFKKAINEINKSIEHLEKTRDALLGSDNNLRLANDKLDNLSIKKLTRNNLTMATKFLEVKKPTALEINSDYNERI